MGRKHDPNRAGDTCQRRNDELHFPHGQRAPATPHAHHDVPNGPRNDGGREQQSAFHGGALATAPRVALTTTSAAAHTSAGTPASALDRRGVDGDAYGTTHPGAGAPASGPTTVPGDGRLAISAYRRLNPSNTITHPEHTEIRRLFQDLGRLGRPRMPWPDFPPRFVLHLRRGSGPPPLSRCRAGTVASMIAEPCRVRFVKSHGRPQACPLAPSPVRGRTRPARAAQPRAGAASSPSAARSARPTACKSCSASAARRPWR